MSRLYVSNVSSKGKIEELRALFEECGKIKSFGVKDEAGYMVWPTLIFLGVRNCRSSGGSDQETERKRIL